MAFRYFRRIVPSFRTMSTVADSAPKPNNRLVKFVKVSGIVGGTLAVGGGIYYSTLDRVEQRKVRVAVGGIRRFIR